jgi:hypothetical protein
VQLDVDAHLECALGEHQRKLVERQRPRQPRGRDEGDAVRVAALDVLDEAVQRLGVGRRTGEYGGAGVRARGDGAGGDQQDVVADALAVRGLHGVLGGVDARQLAGPEREAGVAGDALERVAPGAAGRERLEHAERAIGEVGVWGEQGRRDAIAREAVEPERGFERGGTAAGDEDVRGHWAMIGALRRRGVRRTSRPRCGKPAVSTAVEPDGSRRSRS